MNSISVEDSDFFLSHARVMLISSLFITNCFGKISSEQKPTNRKNAHGNIDFLIISWKFRNQTKILTSKAVLKMNKIFTNGKERGVILSLPIRCLYVRIFV